MTRIPRAAGGDVGGARSSTTWFMVVPAVTASAAATAGVVALKILVQFRPPSVERITPLPLTPAYRMRAVAGEVRSSTRDRASPPEPVPCVQFKPESVDR